MAEPTQPQVAPSKQGFKENRKAILGELRKLVLQDVNTLETILSGKKSQINNVSGKVDPHTRRKWDLFLKYQDETDFELEELKYMEFRKLFLASKNEQKR